MLDSDLGMAWSSSLTKLDLAQNYLTDESASTIALATNLKWISLAHNKFTSLAFTERLGNLVGLAVSSVCH